jgi:hypothetical protein
MSTAALRLTDTVRRKAFYTTLLTLVLSGLLLSGWVNRLGYTAATITISVGIAAIFEIWD